IEISATTTPARFMRRDGFAKITDPNNIVATTNFIPCAPRASLKHVFEYIIGPWLSEGHDNKYLRAVNTNIGPSVRSLCNSKWTLDCTSWLGAIMRVSNPGNDIAVRSKLSRRHARLVQLLR